VTVVLEHIEATGYPEPEFGTSSERLLATARKTAIERNPALHSHDDEIDVLAASRRICS
jgi:hypothetical protein